MLGCGRMRIPTPKLRNSSLGGMASPPIVISVLVPSSSVVKTVDFLGLTSCPVSDSQIWVASSRAAAIQ